MMSIPEAELPHSALFGEKEKVVHFPLLLQSGKWTLGEAKPEPRSGQEKHRFLTSGFALRFASLPVLPRTYSWDRPVGLGKYPQAAAACPPRRIGHAPGSLCPQDGCGGRGAGWRPGPGPGPRSAGPTSARFPQGALGLRGPTERSAGFSGGAGPGPSSGLPGLRHPPTHRRRAAGSSRDRAWGLGGWAPKCGTGPRTCRRRGPVTVHRGLPGCVPGVPTSVLSPVPCPGREGPRPGQH